MPPPTPTRPLQAPAGACSTCSPARHCEAALATVTVAQRTALPPSIDAMARASAAGFNDLRHAAPRARTTAKERPAMNEAPFVCCPLGREGTGQHVNCPAQRCARQYAGRPMQPACDGHPLSIACEQEWLKGAGRRAMQVLSWQASGGLVAPAHSHAALSRIRLDVDQGEHLARSGLLRMRQPMPDQGSCVKCTRAWPRIWECLRSWSLRR